MCGECTDYFRNVLNLRQPIDVDNHDEQLCDDVDMMLISDMRLKLS